MEDAATIFMIPTIIFLVIVAPVCLVLHYRSKRQQGVELNESERKELEELMLAAERMTDRIVTLERILDVEAPGWRDKAEQT